MTILGKNSAKVNGKTFAFSIWQNALRLADALKLKIDHFLTIYINCNFKNMCNLFTKGYIYSFKSILIIQILHAMYFIRLLFTLPLHTQPNIFKQT